MGTTTGQRVDRALLIGIDKYMYIAPDLGGCVNDVVRLRRFLIDTMATPESQIATLTADIDGGETATDLATRANIVDRFMRLADAAQKDEQIYIHYSGHGMRNDYSLLPDLEADGRDEAIAPTDSGYEDPANFYLLDKELGWLIHRITEKGAYVTVVMDCCHSASNTRALTHPVNVRRGQRRPEDIGADREYEGGDPRPRPDATLVAPLAEIRRVLTTSEGRSGSLLPGPKGYVLLTGCREQQTAKEYKRHGILTYFMLERLAQGTAGLTYRTLLDCASARILELASQPKYKYDYADQTPQLEGDGSLLVFGGSAVADPRAMIAVPQPDGSLVLTGGGAAIGMTVGSTVALYPPGALHLDDPSAEIGIAVVTRVETDTAKAKVTSTRTSELPAGMKAVVIRPGSAKVRRRIGLGEGEALERVKEAITRVRQDGAGSPYLDVVGLHEGPELSVCIKDGVYVILDYRDEPLPRITPPLRVDAAEAVDKLVSRLEHVVKYLNAWELHNEDASSWIRDQVSVSVHVPTGRSAGSVSLRPGDVIDIRVYNRTREPLSAALLYFSPDWKIECIWPERSDYTELAPTSENGLCVIKLDASLPEGVDRTTERLKLIATAKPSSLAALMLGSLDHERAVVQPRAIANPLEQMLRALGNGGTTRNLTRHVGTGDWTTAELILETTR